MPARGRWPAIFTFGWAHTMSSSRRPLSCGAHCGAICDASTPTFMLTHWARDRDAVRPPARAGGAEADRETARSTAWATAGVAPGYRADLNVIDFDGFSLQLPSWCTTSPAARAGSSSAPTATGTRSWRARRPCATARRPAPVPASSCGACDEPGNRRGDVLLETPVSPTRVTAVKIPVSRYTSPEFFAREMVDVWPTTWQLACTVDHVANPGDWYEYRVGQLSVLIVRGDDGELRAFQNVCRHRGSALCRASGSGLTEIRCAYHRWCWDLDGRLREVPSRRGFGVLNDDSRSSRCRSARGAPLVFVNLDLDAEPLADFLEAVPADTAVARPRRLPLHVRRRDADAVQLEDADRRLQRDVPRAGHPPRDAAR